MDKLIRTTCFKGVKRCLLALVFLVLGVFQAVGQNDVSGFYYIANHNGGFNSNDPTNNWYLVPASNCGGPSSLAVSAWAWNDDEETPFLTTYKTSQDNTPTCQEDYNSVWQIIKVEGDDGYYFIKHCNSGKYVVYNTPEYTNRRAFHLEASNDPSSLGDNARFEIKYTSGSAAPFYFLRKNLTTDDKYWNPSNGNYLSYYGIKNNDGQNYVRGLIGVYNDNGDAGSKWTLEVPRPVISFDNVTHMVSISSTLDALNPNYDFYYTTTGSNPTTSSTPYNGPFECTTANTVIKAIAVSHSSSIKSVVTSFTLQKVATPTIQADPTLNFITITSNTEGTIIYYTDDGSEPTRASYRYFGPLDFSYSMHPIKAIALKYNMLDSNSSEPAQIKIKCPKPDIQLVSETNQVYLSCDADAASIYYTLDGTDPTTSSTLYEGTPFTLPTSGTIKAFAAGVPNCFDSDIASCSVNRAAMPELNVVNNYITITTATPDATVYYTIDGSNPTPESIRYSGPFREGPNHEHVSGVVIKAIAVKQGMSWSNVGSGTLTLTCEPPLINRTGANTFTLTSTFPTSDARIYYTFDNSTPTILYEGPITHTAPCTIRAMVVADNYNGSAVAERSFTNDLQQENDIYLIQCDYDYTLFVNKANTTEGSSKHYKLVTNISAANTNEVTRAFTGLFEGSADAEGNFYTISDLTHPMFKEVQGGVVRNVILDNVLIQAHDGSAGAIACDATTGACIYNCGVLNGKVGGTKSTGGIVGFLRNYSGTPTRVLNCFSFAEITSGSYVSGIVGQNYYGSTSNSIQTIVMNCLFYGEISGGETKAPVYGNKLIDNSGSTGINLYDYFLESASFDDAFTGINSYKRSWPAEERFLNRFGYYRSILNSNRRLCTWWVTQKQYDEQTEEDLNLIAKWVLDPSIKPYPILKKWDKYPSLINPDPNKVLNEDNVLISREDALPYQGKKLGTLTVNVNAGSHYSNATLDEPLQLPILDMDTLHHDYCYAKVQLPYYNALFGNPSQPESNYAARYANNYTDKVVTGWKIVAVNDNDQGSGYTFDDNWESGCNFADRSDKYKDLYAKSGRVFAQGGYYYVPEGVTSITIEAYWGKAVYLRNKGNYIDRVKQGDEPFTPAGKFPSTFHGYTVYTDIKTAINSGLDLEGEDEKTVYDQALVLVGNLQLHNSDTVANMGWVTTNGSEEFATQNRPFTMTSVDLDFDNEPDFCFEWQFSKGTTRLNLHPIRFDFLPVSPLGRAIRTGGALQTIGTFVPRGHFEITETAFMHTSQFEYDGRRDDYRKKEAPVILNGGEFEQIVSAQSDGNLNRTKYIILGGHVWMKEFTPGKHGDRAGATRHCAVNVMGGEYGRLCLSGVFISANFSGNNPDNPHCYTNGGKFGTISGGGMEDIKGNVTFKIDHSLIGEFYGGGLNAVRPVTGNIDVTINNSIVGKYCGGPYTGDMLKGTSVTTVANNTIFGEFYGGGNGGTNFNRHRLYNYATANFNTVNDPNTWKIQGKFDDFNPVLYVSKEAGYQAQFEFELIDISSGSDNNSVVRTYQHEAQFTATEVRTVTSELNNCTVLQDFYGGGNLGKVEGDVTSTLTNTIVWGSAYGGGNSAEVPTFAIHDKDNGVVFPRRDYGSFNHPGKLEYVKDGGEVRKYKWININDPLAAGHTPTDNPAFQINGEWYCVTEKDMTDLGSVGGNTILNINGNTKIYGSREGVDDLGNPVTLYDGAAFGGGNESTVFGDAMVVVDGTSGLLVSNVFGGGNIAITGGNSTVVIRKGTIGIMDADGMPYSDHHDNFISGRAFAAGKGAYDPDKENNGKQLGLVRGNANLYMFGGHVLSCLYGGGELSNVGITRTTQVQGYDIEIPDSDGLATVTMTGGTVGIERTLVQIQASHEIGNVYGGGKGNPATDFNTWTNVNNAVVNVGGGKVWGSVFGGGEEGHVLANTQVNISGANTSIGTLGETSYDGNVFGGGRGHAAIALTAGTVGGNITVNVMGGHILGSVFGGGRNGSVGTFLVDAELPNHTPHPLYGQMQEGNNHGIINVYVGGTGQDDILIGHPFYNSEDRVGGNVYGGGKGVVADPDDNPIAYEFARVKDTHVYIAASGSKQTFVEGSVFGSGEDGHVMGDTYVMVSGGQIGGEAYNPESPTMCDDVFHGNVYGGGRGLDQWEDDQHNLHYSLTAGKVYGNTNVTITGGRVCRNVFGGGNLAAVGVAENPNSGLAKVTITGGTIGVSANSANRNGLVFGAGKGRAGATYEHLSFVKNTEVTITGTARVMGTVYGSGDDGHVRERTRVVVGNATVDADWNGEAETYSGASVIIGTNGIAGVDGNIYGAGRGIDKDDNNNLSPTAGVVGVSTYIEVNNGKVMGSVYGGGRTSSVGYAPPLAEEYKTPYNYPDFGQTHIIIGRNGDSTGENDHATIGTQDGENGYVFGAGKGDAGQEFRDLTWVHETKVEIKGHALVRGAVFGGGEDGHVNDYHWQNTPENPTQVVNKDGDTHVLISGNCSIGEDGATGRKGNVYGGGRGIDQYVDPSGNLHYSPTAGRVAGSTHVTVTGGDVWQNVYGGGNKSTVGGHKTVNLTDGWVHKNVYGGSNEIPFDPTWSHAGLKTVNMMGGKAHKLFGCSHNTIDGSLRLLDGNRVIDVIIENGEPKLYYHDTGDEFTGDVSSLTIEAENTDPTSFVNISGGYLYDTGEEVGEHEQGSIHGAGLAGVVYGSVMVNIGANAVLNAPYHEFNVDVNDIETELQYFGVTNPGTVGHQVSKMQVSCSVFGGADYYQSENNPGDWNHFNVKGYSNIYIDGQDYDMDTEIDPNTSFNNLPDNCMVLDGNIYGSGTHCESGELGRNIIVRNYGVRVNSTASGQTDWFDHSTRPMGTIQRCGNLVIDNSNFTFTGMPQLGHNDGNLYSIMKVDSCLYIANSSALTLGSGDVPAHMDSIRRLQSAYLRRQSPTYNVFSEKFVEKLTWGWIGLKEPSSDYADVMCFMKANDSDSTALTKAQENIILFNGPTKLWVRYHDKKPSDTQFKQYYGELKGFFRMLSPYRPKGIESFAFARPKIMDDLLHSTDHYNMADGGFLSYNTSYNDFHAGGWGSYSNFTNTVQYPYTNVIQLLTKGTEHIEDVQDYRMWVMASPFEGNCWYVDGTRGWGRDIMQPASGETGISYNWKYGWGLYPDKPKQSISFIEKNGNDTIAGGVFAGTYILNGMGVPTKVNFDYDGSIHITDETTDDPDIIFVVGPIKDVNEIASGLLNNFTGFTEAQYELKLYRYPGGHRLSNSTSENEYLDVGGGTLPTPPALNQGLSGTDTHGPGPNYGAMLDVTGDKAITLNNVYMDGLYGHTSIDRTYLKFKETDFTQNNVNAPMIVTSNGASLTLKGALTTVGGKNRTTGTIVTRGYNNIDASESNNYYVNSNETNTVNGGGLYVHNGATVNVEGLVSIFENKQKNGSDAIPSNVFLPTFNKHLNITNALSEATRIGVTSPVKNAQTGANAYLFNTFSPVAVGVREGHDNGVGGSGLAWDTIDTKNAWLNNNFHDDLHWFFGRGFNVENGSHTAYYKEQIADYPTTTGFDSGKTLFFGWTWNNVVRAKPAGYAVVSGQRKVEITTKEGLAWLISKVNGLNGQIKSDMADTTLMVTAEIDGLDQYIWVPAGSEKVSTANFAGTFDGRGHLIRGLTIRYIGIGDSRYEYNNYGMFGKTNGATLNRTFLIGEYIEPNSKSNMGGLIGMMQGTGSVVSNSETAVEIKCEPDQQTAENACGGLVGFLIDGEIHSSMSMPNITAKRGFVGGLVGSSSDPESNSHNGVKLCNSFTNAQFSFDAGASVVAGGLLGNNVLSTVENCYANLTHTGDGNLASLVHTNTGVVNKCYGKSGYSINFNDYGNHIANCYNFTSTIGADNLGYMYSDNVVTIGTEKTPLFEKLNEWVPNTTYAKWARPGLAEINGDMPVQMLCNYNDSNKEGLGDFSSMATITGVPKALQFGGVVRDGNELDGAFASTRLSTSDALFVYGDITTAPTATPVAAAKISIYEHASIQAVGTLSSHDNTYIGISFDNSFANAVATNGVNYGLAGAGGDLLPRDWHMFSTPLSNAPLGFDYGSTNTNTYPDKPTGENIDQGTYYNNPWVSIASEFSWLNGGTTGDTRYWMKTFNETVQTTDGYFPTLVDESVITRDDNLFVVGSDECPETGRYRYPYGMDFYTWTEPCYHWINFKRNGPNHWHSDENNGGHHDHLDYVTEVATNNPSAETNVNEDVLISGKGYLASITKPTFMQSHGTLNSGTQTINLTADGKYVTGWNLVGNPFHGYIDFDSFSSNTNNGTVLSKNDNSMPFYVVYDADTYDDEGGNRPGCGFLYQPKTGSEGAAYAGRFIHPHQGFYVKLAEKPSSKDNPPHLEFTESMLVSRADIEELLGESHFHKSVYNYPLVNLYLSSENGCRDVTVIEFHRPEWGGATKLKELRVGNGLFYGHHGDDNYAALFVKEGAKKVPLWFEAKENDIYTIAWKTANGDFPSMYLVDNLTGVKYDMVEHHSYTFQGRRNDYWSRFYITFSLDEEEPEPEDNSFVFFDGSQWVITGDGDLEVIDVLGRVLKRVRVSEGQNRISLPNVASGVYLMRLTNRKQCKVQKVIVTK